MLKKLLATLLVVSVLASLAVFGTFAVFNDSQSVGSNTFSTGSVDISTSPTTALVTFSNMAPGDEVTNPITVTNDGSLELRHGVTSMTPLAIGPNLAAQLDLTIKSGVTTCTNAGFDADGTVIYGPGDLGSGLIGGMNIIGNPAQGAHPGDRTLAAGAKEDLCFNVELPSSTDNTYQGLSAAATFNFQAEQTKNNP